MLEELIKKYYQNKMQENKILVPSFEESLNQVENLIKQLEAGDVPLDKWVDYYQTGMKVLMEANKQLNQAQLKIETLQMDQDI